MNWYSKVFGAVEGLKLTDPSGKIGHVELDFGGTTIMVSDAFPEYGVSAPEPGDRVFVAIHLHVDDTDAIIDRAVENGAEIIHPPNDHFYGERSGRIRDPFGHEWIIGHSIEEVSPEEMQRRYDALGDAS
ncbi:MAG: VOC family protein [Rhodothermales bacterium]|nr:VOC family protein [Rhodothermales bacterium]